MHACARNRTRLASTQTDSDVRMDSIRLSSRVCSEKSDADDKPTLQYAKFAQRSTETQSENRQPCIYVMGDFGHTMGKACYVLCRLSGETLRNCGTVKPHLKIKAFFIFVTHWA